MSNSGYNTTSSNVEAETDKKIKGNPKLPSSDKELSRLMDLDEGTYSVEDFLRNPEQSSFKISPNGAFFSYLAPYQNRLNIFIQKIGDKSARRITAETERDLFSYFWANNDKLLYIKDEGGDENYKLYVVDREGKETKDLTPFEDVKIGIIDDLEDIEEEIIISMNKENKQLFEPYRLNIETGALSKIAENKDPSKAIASWITDHDGKLRAAVRAEGTDISILYRQNETDDFRVVRTTNFKEELDPLFFDFDNGDMVYALSNMGRDKRAVVKFNMATGKETEVLFEHPDVDVSHMSYSKKRKVLTYISYVKDKRAYQFLDDEAEQIYNRIKGELSRYEVVLTSTNKNEDKYLVRTYSDRSLGAYYFYDKASDSLTHLVDVSPWLNEEDLAEMKPIQYKSRDGLNIHGYLTLPLGKEPKDLPVIINPHGGPFGIRDEWQYNPEVQLLANRGYAVFQINYRGSGGYGRSFREAGYNQVGRKMQDDLTDGVKFLISKGIADPDKVAIYGASYGGYATLAGLAFTPDLYVCGVDYVGVSNLFTFYDTIPPYWKPYRDMIYEMWYHQKQDSAIIKQVSPVFHVDRIKAPLFVVQGANDPRVNIDESDQIVESLRARGVDVPYMVKYNEGHGFGNEENRFEFYKSMTGFLAKHLKHGKGRG